MAVKPQSKVVIRIGTRGSPLALLQAQMAELRLHSVLPGLRTQIVPIRTSGDAHAAQKGDQPLPQTEGGKALFAKEIQEALLKGQIDMAVHSMKDLDTFLPDALTIPCMLPREAVQDAFLSNIAQNISDLPKGSTVGTSSPRRKAFLLAMRPDLKVVPLRGNVETRIEKLNAKQVDATFLAVAGLNRLRKQNHIKSVVPAHEMMPCAGQGAIGIEVRRQDAKLVSVLGQINHDTTYACVACERAVLTTLGASCQTPVGVHAELTGLKLRIRAQLAAPDGSGMFRDVKTGHLNSYDDLIRIGHEFGRELKEKAPVGFFG
ncbi:MAG: hydroxymethylbilane synthase [Alphaproteobacteria bacterium]|nr:hydroxymethylbilane synthase [Alphaproteobacteria bacterium]